MNGGQGGARAKANIAALAYRFLEQSADLAGLDRYAAANRALEHDGDPRPRVVLMGDSLFAGWPGVEALAPPQTQLVNRGVAGQTSGQILLRFATDVIALRPLAVVILAGSNDLRAWLQPTPARRSAALRRIAANVTAMADMAGGRGLRVGLCSLTPVNARAARAGSGARRRDPEAIREVNRWIAAFAAARAYPFADLHTPLTDGDGALEARLTDNGLHPNAAGYARMKGLLGPVLARLAQPAADQVIL